MAASMDINVPMDQIMSLGRPTRKAKEDANSKIIITDSNNFQHQMSNNLNNSSNLQGLHASHYANYYRESSEDMMPMGMDGGYGHYHTDISQGYNPPTFETRAKSFDIATINHLEQPMGKTGDDNHGNMGPPAAKKKRGRQTNVISTIESENNLYGSIRFGKVPIQTLVDDWIEQYNLSREPAMLDLMQFFVSCCGCKGRITSDIFTQAQGAVIRKLTNEFDEESGEYPLIQNNSKRFRSNFVDFVQVLIRQCQYSIIYDQYLVDQLTSLLTVLTDSQVRAFRHTGTLAAMKMMTALVDVTLNISINRENNQRQLEAERGKTARSKPGGNNDRLQTLTRRHGELEENMAEVKNMLTFLVKGVFVHRYRDSQPEIRCICMEEIGVWMQRFPAIFLDDSYLKYVGWTLYDRVGIVRAQCLRTLQPLYEERNLVTNLELFTSRFKGRLVDMTLDKDVEVAVQAVKVVSCILRYNEAILEDRDCENIYELVYCTNRGLAQAAGEFLNQKLFQVDAGAPVTKTKKGKRRSEHTPLVRDLVQFFIESELHEHAGYLVDSLWEAGAGMVRDWECMVDLLLEEPGKGEASLSSAQETSLLEILYWCVRQASTGESPVGRQPVSHSGAAAGLAGGGGRRAPTGKEARALQEDRARLTEVLIPALPALVAKYGEDVAKVTNVVQLPLFMSLELYTSGRYERYLDLLLKHLQETVERHTDRDLLLHVSQVFELLCAEELSISTKCQTARGTLLDRLAAAYRRNYAGYYGDEAAAGEPSQDDAFKLHAAIKRLGAFYACHNLRSLDLWDSLTRICESAHSQAVFHEEIVADTIGTCALALLWQLNLGEDSQGRPPTSGDLAAASRNLRAFLGICRGYLDHQSALIAQESYKSVCDLLIVCSRHLIAESPLLEPLVYEADGDLQGALVHFLEQRVFVEDEPDEDENVKIEELHNRRTNLGMFFKLIIYNVLPIRAVAPLYKFYLRFFNDFGDIMKSALAKAREINRVQTARMVMECLATALQELQAEGCGAADRSTEGFQALKDLARRLNLSFGLDLVKIREAMVELHKAALDRVLAGGGVHLLELAAEFSNKLLGADKRLLLEHVGRLLPASAGGLAGETALSHYRASLDPEAGDGAASVLGGSVHSGPSQGGGVRPRGRPKKAAPSALAHSTALRRKRPSHAPNHRPRSRSPSSVVGQEAAPAQAAPQQVSSRGRLLKTRTSLAEHLSGGQ